MAEHTRKRERFEDGWLFHKGDIPIRYAVKAGMTGGLTDNGKLEDGVWLDIAFVDKGMNAADIPGEWSPVQLPHDWCVEGQYVNDPNLGSRPASNGYLPVGAGFYRKEFLAAAEDADKLTSIVFDGVMGRATVWVNGHLIGEHFSGYTSVVYDVTDVLRYGSEGSNVILVKVDATEYEGWWYEGCGIYRHVWLETTHRVRVAPWGTYVTTPEVTDAQAIVSVRTRLLNHDVADCTVRLSTTLIAPEGDIICRHEEEATAAWFRETELEQRFEVEGPRLWSPDTPNLYKAVSEIEWNGCVIDRFETTYGIRDICFDAEAGFLLNGKPLPIKGVCAHQDFAGVGVALPDSLMAYKIRLLKEMGCNAYRSAHHPASPALLDICDRLGMLVMDENRKLDSSPRGLEDLKSLLLRDRNHPSIIMWGLENEEILEGTVMGARIAKTLADFARSIDPTRPTVASMNHGWNDGGYAESVDIVGYNYGQRDDQDVNDRLTYPGRLMIGSESASYTTTRGVYADDPLNGYASAYGTSIPSWGCSPEKAWGDVVRHPFLTGVFLWTGFDYRGEPTPYEWPCVNSHFGIMDTCGFPKDIYYYVKGAWTSEPLVHAFPHWNWEGREGETIPVWVYSNCDQVELVLNGRSLGRRNVDTLSHSEWDVVYEKGELVAIGLRDGEAIATHRIVTAGHAYALRLEADREWLAVDGCDTLAVKVAVVDADGNVVPTADNRVTFHVEGGGHLLGVGNGNPSSHEPDKASMRRAFNGYALALVQSGGAAGGVVLRAQAAGLREALITIDAR